MKVYLVIERCIDDFYDGSAVKVYANRESAEKWIDDQDHPADFSVREMEVEK